MVFSTCGPVTTILRLEDPFLNVDPAAPSKVDDQSLDPYAYCLGTIRSAQVDPTGRIVGHLGIGRGTPHLVNSESLLPIYSVSVLWDMTHVNRGVKCSSSTEVLTSLSTRFGHKQAKEQVREGLGLQETMSAG